MQLFTMHCDTVNFIQQLWPIAFTVSNFCQWKRNASLSGPVFHQRHVFKTLLPRAVTGTRRLGSVSTGFWYPNLNRNFLFHLGPEYFCFKTIGNRTELRKLSVADLPLSVVKTQHDTWLRGTVQMEICTETLLNIAKPQCHKRIALASFDGKIKCTRSRIIHIKITPSTTLTSKEWT